jgi:hypothetical protein
MGVVGFSNVPESIEISVGKNSRVAITIANTGPVPVHDISVSARSDCEGLEVSITPQVISVIEAEQSGEFTLSLTANYTVKPGSYMLTFMMNTTEGTTDSFSSTLVVSVGAPEVTEPEALEISEPEPQPVVEEEAPAGVEGPPEGKKQGVPEAPGEVEGSGAPSEEPTPAPEALTSAEVPKYEAQKEKKPITERFNKKTLTILLIVVLVGVILVLDMANFVDLGIL